MFKLRTSLRHFNTANLLRSDLRQKLPKRIPAGGKDSNELGGGNCTNGNGVDGGEMLSELKDELHGWKEKHASDSEAIVKAERHGDRNDAETLQKKTVEHFEKQVTFSKVKSKLASPNKTKLK